MKSVNVTMIKAEAKIYKNMHHRQQENFWQVKSAVAQMFQDTDTSHQIGYSYTN